MSERRGHQKLRLCSKKNYEWKRAASKRHASLITGSGTDLSVLPHGTDLSCGSIHQQRPEEMNQEVISLNISVPLSFFTDQAVLSLDVLDRRLQKIDTTCEGSYVLLLIRV